MPVPLSPRELARRVLAGLEAQALDPTPDNYSRLYAELSDSCPPEATAPPVGSLAHYVYCLAQATETLHETLRASQREMAEVKSDMRSMHEELERTCKAIERDALTGCLNRVGLDHLLSCEVSRARRHGTPLCAVLFDLDKFKAVNDVHGHALGDQILIHIAQLTRSVLRDSDHLVRYGGDEFLILLPQTDASGAGHLVERLQRRCAGTPYMHQQLCIPMTISAGITGLLDEQNGHALLLRADAALYSAKAAGRNTYSLLG